jgi:hypothetical protein
VPLLNYLGIERTTTESVVRYVGDIHLEFMLYSLATLRLRPEVFETPPVTIWPDLQRRVVLPADVEAFLARFEAPANMPRQPRSDATPPGGFRIR